MNKWIGRVIVLLILLGMGFVVKEWILAPEPIAVTTVTVDRGRVEETVTNSRAGTVKARQRAKLSPEIGGRILGIPHRKGDRVKAGDVLLRLNDSTQRAKLLMVRQDLQVAEVRRERTCLEADRAQREFVRNQHLREQDLVSTDFLDKIESAAKTTAVSCKESQAEIQRAQAAIEEATAELKKTVLHAPFDGVIAELDTEVGEWTTPSPPALPIPPVIDLIDPSSIYISAPMDEVDSSRIRLNQPVRVTLDPFPQQDLFGSVVRIAPYVLDVEEQNRTVEIEVELADQAFASTLLPGTSADVEVILSVKEDVLRLPTSTLFGGNKVFEIVGGHLAERVIKPGLKNWDYVEIAGGLTGGELVVSSLDQKELSAGVPVVVRDRPVVP